LKIVASVDSFVLAIDRLRSVELLLVLRLISYRQPSTGTATCRSCVSVVDKLGRPQSLLARG